MPEILVTGGAGFIGSHTVVELLNVGFNCVIVDNMHNASHGNVILFCFNLFLILRGGSFLWTTGFVEWPNEINSGALCIHRPISPSICLSAHPSSHPFACSSIHLDSSGLVYYFSLIFCTKYSSINI